MSSPESLGDRRCVNYDWRWIFLINIPIGVLSLGLGLLFAPMSVAAYKITPMYLPNP